MSFQSQYSLHMKLSQEGSHIFYPIRQMYWYVMSSSEAKYNNKNWRSSLQWRHNEPDGVSNHQPHNCLLNRLFKRRSRKTSNLRATGLCEGNSPVTGEFPHKGPATRKMFPFDDVIMGVYFNFQWMQQDKGQLIVV